MSSTVEAETPAPATEEETQGQPSLLVPLQDGATDDVDSIYTESVRTETTSLKSSIAKYREENGRTYHSYGSTE